MKKEFSLAFNEVLDDKQLPREVIVQAVQDALIQAYRKTVNASQAQLVQASIDDTTGEVKIFAEKEVVEDVMDERTEVLLDVARKYDPNAELGDIVVVESTPENFGRVAAQTARQMIQQRIREAEREAQKEYFSHLTGEIVNGIVQAANPHMITLALDRKAEGKMPRGQQIPGERFRVHDRVRALLLEIKDTTRGPEIILSRAHRDFLRRLLEDEVPEIYQGLVEIRSIAREPGYRSKVAVSALQSGIDPVGACVGIRGVRIQAIVRELHDEKIDVIEWNTDPAQFIAKALSPARVAGVYLDEAVDGNKTATVVVPEDQLSLAIGRDGQNARLAAKLTGWRIDIKSLTEAAADALHQAQANAKFAKEHADWVELLPQIEMILAKKSEGRPITPEEYTLLSRFVERLERGEQDRREAILDAQREERAAIEAQLPKAAFSIPLEELGLAPSLAMKISGDGFSTIGDLLLQLKLDSSLIQQIEGVGPVAIASIQEKLDAFVFPEPEPEPEPEPAPEPQAEAPAEPEAVLVEQPEATARVAEEYEEDEKPVELTEEDEKLLAQMQGGQAPEAQVPALSVDEVFARTEEQLLGKAKVAKGAAPAEPDKKKKAKKKKYRELDYDPDEDVTYTPRRDEWEDLA
ncbi:MAG: transcription termination/antitermination protein NusA [Anaerolineales bacterium]|nr:transcription termination/antitermination protein NusA [Anaerolineales bacterium]MCW5855243.1 transcription termination/antitermination protein NusA [Anaerolineales bacterium]